MWFKYFFCFFGFIALTGCVHQPVQNVEKSPIPLAASGMNDAQMASAISKAAATRSWACTQSGPGQLVCQTMVRKFSATVQVTYDKNSFSINYRDSSNLKDKENELIHKNYNKWIFNLRNAIIKELNSPSVH